jgi:toxin-antitoxin system PIN domain toxin
MVSCLLDLNVWVAIAYRRHEQHLLASSWLDQLEDGSAAFCRITQLGFLRLMSHPAIMRDQAMTQIEAWNAYGRLAADSRIYFQVEPDSHALGREFRALTSTVRRSPQQWADAYLAAFARVAGLTLVTFDQALSKLARGNVLLLD